MRYLYWFLFLLATTWLLASCGVGDSPTQGAKEWIDGAVNSDGNKTLKRTCLAQRESLKNATLWTSAFSVIGRLFTNQEMKGDMSDLKFETISQNGDQAEVRVYGELRVAISGFADAQQLDEVWSMIKENDTWRWCGSAEETFRNQLLNTAYTISTFRLMGTQQFIKENKIVTATLEFEYVNPDKGHGVYKYENGDTSEFISVNGQTCERDNNTKWGCRNGGTLSLTTIYAPAMTTEHSTRLDMRAEKQCRLYEATFNNETNEVCFDLTTGYPVQFVSMIETTQDGVTRTLRTEVRFYDFNTPITITLPTP